MRVIVIFSISFLTVLCAAGTYLVFAGADGSVPPPEGRMWLYEMHGQCLNDTSCELWYTLTKPAKIAYMASWFMLLTLLFYGLPKTKRRRHSA